jgi:hypothetical protein
MPLRSLYPNMLAPALFKVREVVASTLLQTGHQLLLRGMSVAGVVEGSLVLPVSR